MARLRQADIELGKGLKVPEVCKQLGINEQAYYRWRQKYGGMDPLMAKQMKEIEKGERAAQAAGEAPLTQRVIELVSMFGRYGYRRVTSLLRLDGWWVNHKRVDLIWRQEGLKVPKKQRKRGRLWFNDGSCVRLRPAHRDHVWAYDFVHGRTRDGRSFRMLAIIDEFTRECLAIDMARKPNHDDVLEHLTWLMATRGVPDHTRLHSAASSPRRQCVGGGMKTLDIEPGSPWENGYVESFNGKLADELLEREVFDTLLEAKVLIERWRVQYNMIRPHSSLDYRPPAPAAWLVDEAGGA